MSLFEFCIRLDHSRTRSIELFSSRRHEPRPSSTPLRSSLKHTPSSASPTDFSERTTAPDDYSERTTSMSAAEEAAELDSGGCYFPVVRIRPCSYNNNEVAICKQNIQQDPA